ncbi:hypothetical protein KAR91_09775, partial [Candidatus Pacearchaeota archaeon]|nr:hypothetical protein [Candidatus Pacearchaeota archaeon]
MSAEANLIYCQHALPDLLNYLYDSYTLQYPRREVKAYYHQTTSRIVGSIQHVKDGIYLILHL